MVDKVEWRPSQILVPKAVPLKWLLENHNTFFVDNRLIQRLLDPWELDRRNEYINDILTGASCKDLIILAQIEPILKEINARIEEYENVKNDKKIKALEENRDYFQDLSNKGYTQICIDGQHRIQELVTFFQLKTHSEPFVSPNKAPVLNFGYRAENDEYRDFDINRKTFKEFPESIRNFIIENIMILVVFIQNGDIKSLKGLFKRANDGTPIGFFQDLISGSYGSVFRWVVDFHDEKKQTKNVMSLDKKFPGFTKQYSKKNKGLAYFNTECLLYAIRQSDHSLSGNTKEGLKAIFDDEFYLSPKIKELASSNINIIADGIKDKKSLKPLKKASYANAFIFLCVMRDKSHSLRQRDPYNIPVYKVKKPKEFMKWFLELETKRLNSNLYIMDGDKVRTRKNPSTGKIEQMKNPFSYNEKNRRVWHLGDIVERLETMWEDFRNEHQDLELKQIIVQEGKKFTNQAKTRLVVAAENDWKDSFGRDIDVYEDLLGDNSKYDIGHIISKDSGGSNDIENAQLEPSSSNRKQQNR